MILNLKPFEIIFLSLRLLCMGGSVGLLALLIGFSLTSNFKKFIEFSIYIN